MTNELNFCGASGASYRFRRLRSDASLVGIGGIVLFASGDCSGWRVIDVGQQTGQEAGSVLAWRWRKAQRFGASAIFVRDVVAEDRRSVEVADLRRGLDPVFEATPEQGALAA